VQTDSSCAEMRLPVTNRTTKNIIPQQDCGNQSLS